MEQIVQTIALSMGVAWASGINLYAAIFMLGYMGMTGHIDLPPDLQVLSDPLVLFAAGFMYCVEFFADKTPGVDTAWDGIHSFIRIPAGAMLAAGAIGDVSQAAEIAAALLGGSLAAGSHLTKAGSRVLINTSPEPFSNWTASITEDLMVIGGLWTALNHPWLFLGLLLLFIALMIWLLPKLWRGIKGLFAFLGQLFGGGSAARAPPAAGDSGPAPGVPPPPKKDRPADP
ncbi:DUF4126 domain-containing protein [Thiohalobacter sp. IOR34]|uniref:DUF4126 domain-containing protein n=1 Tax=Thiohalobacter sp. IOR34 TaxID=3057176 RepID=UPI0025B15DD0|nr:DUF4126 domain-containing protein [Thiohalobacter sp. IOR34]WJW75138.1 DUF4126 domain-containing protein [Thiohalobacter sp. IOR34]